MISLRIGKKGEFLAHAHLYIWLYTPSTRTGHRPEDHSSILLTASYQ